MYWLARAVLILGGTSGLEGHAAPPGVGQNAWQVRTRLGGSLRPSLRVVEFNGLQGQMRIGAGGLHSWVYARHHEGPLLQAPVLQMIGTATERHLVIVSPPGLCTVQWSENLAVWTTFAEFTILPTETPRSLNLPSPNSDHLFFRFFTTPIQPTP